MDSLKLYKASHENAEASFLKALYEGFATDEARAFSKEEIQIMSKNGGTLQNIVI